MLGSDNFESIGFENSKIALQVEENPNFCGYVVFVSFEENNKVLFPRVIKRRRLNVLLNVSLEQEFF
jgi:hypothetical protein